MGPEDGAVIVVPYEHAVALTAIPDGGFAVVDSTNGQLEPTVSTTEEGRAQAPDDVPAA